MILDTNALSALADGAPALGEAIGHERLVLPVIVLGEYRFGIRRSRYRSEYEKWLGLFLDLVQLLPVVNDTALHYAAIFDELKTAGTPIPTNDVWIAALAREHGEVLLTKDRHFRQISGISVVSWE